MELKARSIKLFCAVVETGSLLSAANQNAMSAPAASRAVSQLEDRLGCRLFDRSTKNLTLTEDGKAFYRVAKESMRAWHMLEDFPKQRASTKKQLRIAVLARHCSNVIIPAVAKILKALVHVHRDPQGPRGDAEDHDGRAPEPRHLLL